MVKRRAVKKVTKRSKKATKSRVRKVAALKVLELNVGDKAPDFTLPDTERKARSLSEFMGRKTVLAFFPGAFTSVCMKEMCALRDSLSRPGELNAQVVGISVDSPFANKAFAIQNNLSFPLLCDYGRKIVKLYQVALADFAGLRGYTAAKRAVFVLTEDGIIKYKWVSDDPGVEPNYDEIMNALVSSS